MATSFGFLVAPAALLLGDDVDLAAAFDDGIAAQLQPAVADALAGARSYS